MKLTEQQQWYLDYLKENKNLAFSPTRLGNAYGKAHGVINVKSNSAHASLRLKVLVEKGMIISFLGERRKVKYQFKNIVE